MKRTVLCLAFIATIAATAVAIAAAEATSATVASAAATAARGESGASAYAALLAREAGRQKLVALARMEESRSLEAKAIEALATDSNPLVRLRTAEILGRIADPAGVPALAKLAADRDPLVAETAALSLGLIGGESVIEPLRSLLGRQEQAVRLRALEALDRCGRREAVPIVLPFLTHFHSPVRAQAALTLTFLGDSAAASSCVPLIHDPNPHAAASAAYALGRLGYRDAIDDLAGLLLSESPEIRLRAAEALGRLKAKGAAKQIAGLLRDPERMVRIKAAEALGRIGAGSITGALEDATRSDDPYMRTLALNGFGAIGGTRVLKAALPALADKSAMVRRSAIGAVASAENDEAHRAVLGALGTGTPHERMTALESLGRFGNTDDLALLVAALRDSSDLLVREGAAAGLGSWKKTDELTSPITLPGAQGAGISPLGALRAAADGDDWVVASIAVESLGKIGRPDLIPDLIRIYESHGTRLDGDRRLAVVEAVKSLAAKTGSGDPARSAALALFTGAATCPDPRVAEAAAGAAASLGASLEAHPTGSWDRGTPPWTTPPMPLGKCRILIATARGEIEILLDGDAAPAIVKSILTLARRGFYDGLSFHRVVPAFVIQGGCPRGDGWGDAGYFLRESFNLYRYDRGTVGMATSGRDTPGSQFFITQTAQPHLDGRYTVVGWVVRGMDVVDRIEEGDRFTVRIFE